MKLAEKLREKAHFGHTTTQKLLEKQEEKDAVILFRPKHLHNKFEPNSVKYEGSVKKEDIESWIIKNYPALVDYQQRDNANDCNRPVFIHTTLWIM